MWLQPIVLFPQRIYLNTKFEIITLISDTGWMTIPTHYLNEQEQASARAVAQSLHAGQTTVTIPAVLAGIVGDLLSRMGQGEAVAILNTEQLLTTQEAAELLGISRPHFVAQVLEAGKLPFQMVGTHRRIRLHDLLSYKQQDLAERKQAADELSAEAERLGLPL